MSRFIQATRTFALVALGHQGSVSPQSPVHQPTTPLLVEEKKSSRSQSCQTRSSSTSSSVRLPFILATSTAHASPISEEPEPDKGHNPAKDGQTEDDDSSKMLGLEALRTAIETEIINSDNGNRTLSENGVITFGNYRANEDEDADEEEDEEDNPLAYFMLAPSTENFLLDLTRTLNLEFSPDMFCSTHLRCKRLFEKLGPLGDDPESIEDAIFEILIGRDLVKLYALAELCSKEYANDDELRYLTYGSLWYALHQSFKSGEINEEELLDVEFAEADAGRKCGLGDPERMVELYFRVLDGYESILGREVRKCEERIDEHNNTKTNSSIRSSPAVPRSLRSPQHEKTIRVNLRIASLGPPDKERIKLYISLYNLAERVLGEHPLAFEIASYLGDFYDHAHPPLHAVAQLYFKRAYLGNIVLYGEESHSTLVALANLAISHSYDGNNEKAVELGEKALAGTVRILGTR